MCDIDMCIFSEMSQDMVSIGSDDECSQRSGKSEDEMEDEEDIFNYYNCDTEENTDGDHRKGADPEFFEYDLLKVEDVERLLNESVEALSQAIKVSCSGLVVTSISVNTDLIFINILLD